MIKSAVTIAVLLLSMNSTAYAISQVDKDERDAGAQQIERGLNTHGGKMLKSGVKKVLPRVIRSTGGVFIDVLTPSTAHAPVTPPPAPSVNRDQKHQR